MVVASGLPFSQQLKSTALTYMEFKKEKKKKNPCLLWEDWIPWLSAGVAAEGCGGAVHGWSKAVEGIRIGGGGIGISKQCCGDMKAAAAPVMDVGYRWQGCSYGSSDGAIVTAA